VANQEDSARPVADFRQAVEFIERGLNYEKTTRWQYNRRWLDLRRMKHLLKALGNPHRRYQVIHVAGTKGKGSTAGAIAHCLHRCGLRTGLITSPHLVTPCERARVDGRMISPEDFTEAVRRMQPHVEAERRADQHEQMGAPTYFEMLTALAFDHFALSAVDWAVVEVGLGGRLDSTNVVSPRCCVITAIGFDHMDKLGNTPEAIAGEKAGILKPGVPVVIGRQQYGGALEALRRAAEEHGCPRWEVGRELDVTDMQPLSAPAERRDAPVGWRFTLRTPAHDYEDVSTPMLGRHQLDNLAAALGAVEMTAAHGGLPYDPARIVEAIAGFQVAGRLEVLQRGPALVLDVAHTLESVQAFVDALDAHFPGRPLRVVFGCSTDKNLPGMLGLLAGRCTSFTATQASLPRARPAADVAEAAAQAGVLTSGGALATVGRPWDAVRQALAEAEPQDVVCVTGSVFVAGEVRAGWLEQHPEADDQGFVA
jgi:dihydrofolate synthase/folylpolyglutamate synthase